MRCANRWIRWLPVGLVAAGVLAYSNSFFAPFIFDDHGTVAGRPDIRSLWPTVRSARWVADFTFKLNYALGGLNVWGYHVVNLAIHLVGGLLLYGIIRRTVERPGQAGRFGPAGVWLAAIGATVWVVHPVQTQAVTYIAQRYESLMGLFFLLSLYAFVRGLASRHVRAWLNLSLGACVLGMGVKEVTATLPVVVWLYDWVFVEGGPIRPLRVRWRFYTAMGATWGILLCLRVISGSVTAVGGGSAVSDLSPAVYLGTQFGVILHYLRLAVFPAGLCLDYAWPPVSGFNEVLLPAFIVIGLAAASAWALFRSRPSGFLGAWFFVILAPTSSVLPIYDLAVEHRLYLPLAGVVVLITGAAFSMVARWESVSGSAWPRRAGACLAIGVIAVLIALTLNRNEDYLSEEFMWRDVVVKRPDNLRARNDLAVALCERGRFEEAARHYEYVLEHTRNVPDVPVSLKRPRPGSYAANSPQNNRFRALANMGQMAQQQGDRDRAAILYVRALRILPYDQVVYVKLAHVLREQGVPPERVQEEILRRLTNAL